MGTQFDYSINPLAAPPQGREACPCHGVYERPYSRDGEQKESVLGSSGSGRILESMGEPANKRCLESVRRKLQMQEDTFRKQVRELHRLYGTQKKIMGELMKETEQGIFSSPMKSPNPNFINWPHQTDQMAAGCALPLHRTDGDRGSLDRSASRSGEATKIQRSLDLEIRRPSKGHSSIVDEELPCPKFSAPAKREAECITDRLDEESDVELTLSIGGTSSRRKSKSSSAPYREPEIRSFKKEHSPASVTLCHGDIAIATPETWEVHR